MQSLKDAMILNKLAMVVIKTDNSVSMTCVNDPDAKVDEQGYRGYKRHYTGNRILLEVFGKDASIVYNAQRNSKHVVVTFKDVQITISHVPDGQSRSRKASFRGWSGPSLPGWPEETRALQQRFELYFSGEGTTLSAWLECQETHEVIDLTERIKQLRKQKDDVEPAKTRMANTDFSLNVRKEKAN